MTSMSKPMLKGATGARATSYRSITAIRQGCDTPVLITFDTQEVEPSTKEIIRILVVLDTSGSMDDAAVDLQRWLPDLLRHMGLPMDLPYTLVTFASRCVTTHTTLSKAGDIIDMNGGGTVMAGVAKPLEEFLQKQGGKLILTVSDGDLGDSDVASAAIKAVVSRYQNSETTVLATRWGMDGDTSAMSWFLNINLDSAKMITVPIDITYGVFSAECTKTLLPLMKNTSVCIDGASKLPGDPPKKMTCSLQRQEVLVFVQQGQTTICVNGEEIPITHSGVKISKEKVDEYVQQAIRILRALIIYGLSVTPQIAQNLEDLLTLIESVSEHPTVVVSETPVESPEESKTRLQKLRERLVTLPQVPIQSCDETYKDVAAEIKQLLKMVVLKDLNSSQLNLLFDGRPVDAHSKGLAKRATTGVEMLDALYNELPVLAKALREYFKSANAAAEECGKCSFTHETVFDICNFLAELPDSIISAFTPEDIFEIVGGLPGLTFRAKKTDGADPWSFEIEDVHAVSLHFSFIGVLEARKYNKSQGGNGEVLCPTMGEKAKITGIIPLPSTCGPDFFDMIRKFAPSILNLLGGYSIRGIVASVPGDQAALVCAVMIKLFIKFHDPKETTSLVKEYYKECRSLYTSKYFASLVDAILKHGLAGATSANGASPAKILAGLHFGVSLDENMLRDPTSELSEADELLLRRVAYIKDAAISFRRKIQGNGQPSPPRPDGLNPRDGYIADLCFPTLKIVVSEPFTEDPGCPQVVEPNETDLCGSEWLPNTDKYLSMTGEEFHTCSPDEINGTGEPLFVLIMRAIIAVSENALAEQPPPGEATLEWAMKIPQAIVQTQYDRAIAVKRKEEKEITLNALAEELSTVPCDERVFYRLMREKCPTRAHPLFEKLFARLTDTTDTPKDVRCKLWVMLTGHDKATAEAVLFDGKLGMQWLRIFTTHLLTHGVTQEAIDTARDDWGELYARKRINRHGHSEEFPSYHVLTCGTAKSAEEYCEMFPSRADKYREAHVFCCGYGGNKNGTRGEYLKIVHTVTLACGTREKVEELAKAL